MTKGQTMDQQICRTCGETRESVPSPVCQGGLAHDFYTPEGDAWWVCIEREEVTSEGWSSIALGQYPCAAAAKRAMEDSILVQSELDPPDGGTDCWISQTIPFGYQVILIDLDNPDHTGMPAPDPDEGSAPLRVMSTGSLPRETGE